MTCFYSPFSLVSVAEACCNVGPFYSTELNDQVPVRNRMETVCTCAAPDDGYLVSELNDTPQDTVQLESEILVTTEYQQQVSVPPVVSA